jgi:hypothetical protein
VALSATASRLRRKSIRRTRSAAISPERSLLDERLVGDAP